MQAYNELRALCRLELDYTVDEVSMEGVLGAGDGLVGGGRSISRCSSSSCLSFRRWLLARLASR